MYTGSRLCLHIVIQSGKWGREVWQWEVFKCPGLPMEKSFHTKDVVVAAGQQGMFLSEGLWLPDIYLEGHRTKQFREKLLWDPYVLCRQSECNHCEACMWTKRFLSKIWAIPAAVWYWEINIKRMATIMNENFKDTIHKNVWSNFHGETWKLVQGIQFPVLVP